MRSKEQVIIVNRYIVQRLTIDKFEQKALRELLRIYSRARTQLIEDIATATRRKYHGSTQARLRLLLKEIDDKIRQFTKRLSPAVAEVVGLAGEYSYKDTAAILSWDGRAKDFAYVSMSASQIEAMVMKQSLGDHTLPNWLWRALNEGHKEIKDKIRSGMVRGVGYKQLLKELGTDYKALLGDSGTKSNLETVAKSYIQTINAKAHKDLYEANKDVIKEVEWSAILENGNAETGHGTCPRCMALDGNRYPDVDSGPDCPLHPRCRCMYVPVTKTWKELGFDIPEMTSKYRNWYDRNLMTRKINRLGVKNISKDQTRLALLLHGKTDKDFADWYKSKSKAWQINAVGENRQHWMQKGYFSFNDMVFNKETTAYRMSKGEWKKVVFNKGDLKPHSWLMMQYKIPDKEVKVAVKGEYKLKRS